MGEILRLLEKFNKPEGLELKKNLAESVKSSVSQGNREEELVGLFSRRGVRLQAQ